MLNLLALKQKGGGFAECKAHLQMWTTSRM